MLTTLLSLVAAVLPQVVLVVLVVTAQAQD
jgi:hypothetical protein